jgi:hypothetical protein
MKKKIEAQKEKRIRKKKERNKRKEKRRIRKIKNIHGRCGKNGHITRNTCMDLSHQRTQYCYWPPEEII